MAEQQETKKARVKKSFIDMMKDSNRKLIKKAEAKIAKIDKAMAKRNEKFIKEKERLQGELKTLQAAIADSEAKIQK